MAERPGHKPSLVVTLLASTALVVPFLALELIARRACAEEFPTVLFAFLSIHAFLIVVTLGPALRQLRAGRRISNLGPGGWAGLLIGILLVLVYVNLLIDQWPCFMGIPNCD